MKIIHTILLLAFSILVHASPFDRMDVNEDGRLSRQEFRGPSAALRRLDRNRDGYISRKEARGTRLLRGSEEMQPQQRSTSSPYTVPFIDTHNHLMAHVGNTGNTDYEGAFGSALRTMKQRNAVKNILMPPPQHHGQRNAYDADELLRLAAKNPDLLAVMAGGGSLNVIILEASKKPTISDKEKKNFRSKAEDWLKKGAVGFGEMTAAHFSFHKDHPYISVAPDHPLFLILADVAGGHGVPIDIHMEAIPRDMELPSLFESPPNPARLQANLPAFERLLAHNRKAKVVWVHLGWDSTGARGAEDTRRILKSNSNLYMSIRLPTELHLRHTPEPSRILDSRGKIKPEWMMVFNEFADRFVMGSDEFFMSPQGRRTRHGSTGSAEGSAKFLSQLPNALAKKISLSNALEIYSLKN